MGDPIQQVGPQAGCYSKPAWFSVGTKEGQGVMDTEGTLQRENHQQGNQVQAQVWIKVSQFGAGTREETEDETSRRPDRVLIRCVTSCNTHVILLTNLSQF